MAENITLAPVTTFTNDSSAVATVNANYQLISSAFSDCLSLVGNQPNQMQSALNMNSFNIVNLPAPATLNSPVRLVDVINPSIALTVPPVGTSGSTVPLLNGTNTWSGLQTFNAGINTNQTLSGTLGSAPYEANQFTITNNGQLTGGANFVNGWNYLMGVNAGSTGGIQAVNVSLVMNGAPGAGSSNFNYCAIESSGIATTNLGGTSLAPQGAVFSYGAETVIQNGATHLFNVCGAEFNIAAQTGCSIANKAILQLSGSVTDVVQGSTVDTMVWMFNSNSSPGYTFGFLLDGSSGFFPISTTGTVLRTIGNASGGSTIANGIDLSGPNLTITGKAFKSTGFSVDGSGNLSSLSSFTGAATATVGLITPLILNGGGGLTLGNSTDTLKLGGSAMFTANGAVATTVTSLGPTGSHTTIQEWLTITDSAGTVRYIPCY